MPGKKGARVFCPEFQRVKPNSKDSFMGSQLCKVHLTILYIHYSTVYYCAYFDTHIHSHRQHIPRPPQTDHHQCTRGTKQRQTSARASRQSLRPENNLIAKESALFVDSCSQSLAVTTLRRFLLCTHSSSRLLHRCIHLQSFEPSILKLDTKHSGVTL